MSDKIKGLVPRSEQIELVKNFNDEILWVVHNFIGYITVKNAALITGYTIPGARTGLRRLVKSKLLKEHKYKDGPGRATSIFGITKDGRYQADDDAISKDELIGWNISRLRYDIINHEMAIQKVCHELSEYNGKSALHPPRPIGGTWQNKMLKGGRTADAMLGMSTALEIETTLKSLTRYQNIFSIYDRHNISTWWFAPPKIAAKLDRIVEAIGPENPVTVFNMDEKCNFNETEKSAARGAAVKAQIEAEKQAQIEQVAAAEKAKIEAKQYRQSPAGQREIREKQERIEAKELTEQKAIDEKRAQEVAHAKKQQKAQQRQQQLEFLQELAKTILRLTYIALIVPAWFWTESLKLQHPPIIAGFLFFLSAVGWLMGLFLFRIFPKNQKQAWP